MIPITRPSVGEEEAQAAACAVLSGWLSQGKRVQEFEAAVASYVGAGDGVATTNCTAALHLALVAAGIGPGDEVICPSLSFIATANAVLHAGATPVFVDIDRKSYCIDPNLVEPAITPRTKAIMPVDQIGLAADIPAIVSIARRHRLKVVEDAAPALGATAGELRVGCMSDFTCFSFHPRKTITTGEGGMVMTNDEDAATRLRSIRSHAASISDLARHESEATAIENYRELGFNYRMTDIQAAVGLVQMRKLDAIIAERRRLAARYTALLEGDERVETPCEPEGRQHTYQSYCVWLHSPRPRVDIMGALDASGIATRRGVMAIHLEPFYRQRSTGYSLPITEQAAAETMLLPLYVGMTDGEQHHVIDSLRQALD